MDILTKSGIASFSAGLVLALSSGYDLYAIRDIEKKDTERTNFVRNRYQMTQDYGEILNSHRQTLSDIGGIWHRKILMTGVGLSIMAIGTISYLEGKRREEK